MSSKSSTSIDLFINALKKQQDFRALSRLFSLIENDEGVAAEILRRVGKAGGHSLVIGVTGPPGAGKSTLVDQLIKRFRAHGKRVGIIAIDPTSPFSGGALLGDRIRMQSHAGDTGVFIRSVGTRGTFGGLSRVTRRGIHLMEAFGLEVIFVETVGVGQTELDVMNVVDSVVVILVPESGDAIQTLKAGLMEIADIFVVNKADRPGAETVVRQLKELISSEPQDNQFWKVAVESTEAENNKGVDQVYERLLEHQKFLLERGLCDQRKANQCKRELFEIIETRLKGRVSQFLEQKGPSQLLKDVSEGEMDPYRAADELWGSLLEYLKN